MKINIICNEKEYERVNICRDEVFEIMRRLGDNLSINISLAKEHDNQLIEMKIEIELDNIKKEIKIGE